MRFDIREISVQLAGTACLYNFCRGALAKSTYISLLADIVDHILEVMASSLHRQQVKLLSYLCARLSKISEHGNAIVMCVYMCHETVAEPFIAQLSLFACLKVCTRTRTVALLYLNVDVVRACAKNLLDQFQ